MTVKELKTYLETLDESLEVCILKNSGQGYGDLPTSISPSVKEVETYQDGYQKMLIVNS